MDFIVGLPINARRHDAIMVTINQLTKVAHFSPIRSSYTIAFVARCLEYQRVKADHQHPVGLLQPNLIP